MTRHIGASDADRQITKKLKVAGESLDIKVLDHVIVTETGYFSFSDEGILYKKQPEGCLHYG